MGLKIAVQMDPVHLLNFETDSTISLIKEAQLRDYSVYCYTPAQMFMSAGKVYAKCQTIKIFNKEYLCLFMSICFLLKSICFFLLSILCLFDVYLVCF